MKNYALDRMEYTASNFMREEASRSLLFAKARRENCMVSLDLEDSIIYGVRITSNATGDTRNVIGCRPEYSYIDEI